MSIVYVVLSICSVVLPICHVILSSCCVVEIAGKAESWQLSLTSDFVQLTSRTRKKI